MKISKILLGIVMVISLGQSVVKSAEADIKQVSDLIAEGKESDKAYPISPLVFEMKIKRVGDMGVWNSNTNKLRINYISISKNQIELLSLYRDTMGCTPLRHIPAFPDLENLAKIHTEGEMLKILGIPYGGVGKGDFLKWGYFCIDKSELRILTVRALIDKSDDSGKLLSIEIQTGAK